MRFFCLTTRGLEAISSQEVIALDGAAVDSLAYRRVAGTFQGWPGELLNLRTVDDVFVDLTKWKEVGRPRATLEVLRQNSRELDLGQAVAACAQVRPVDPRRGFTVTASFIGKRNYTTTEIKTAVAAGVRDRYGWQYLPTESGTDVNLRIFIEHELAYVGVRLGARPLHERTYKQKQLPGSLKPPVAAAMLSLAQGGSGEELLDPCCGAGTILIEAASQGWLAAGGDLHPAALQAARRNAATAGASVNLARWNVLHLPLAQASIKHLVCNLPWGRQIAASAGASLERFCAQACAEFRRVLAPGGNLVLLTNQPEWLQFEDLSLDLQIEISLFGQTPTIKVLSSPN